MLSLVHLREGWRIFMRAQHVRREGFHRYKGNANQICQGIVKDCWNGRYFQVSNGNFPEFWTRDFGWCCSSLLKLGYKKEVLLTLQYALKRFAAAGKITTTINPQGKPFDFPYYAPDSLAFLIRSLKLAKAKSLISSYNDFLNYEIGKLFSVAIDEGTGLVRQDKSFSSMEDMAKRKSSCYDNVMVAMLDKDLKAIKILNNPLRSYNFKKLLVDNFWNGEYFLDDLSGKSYVAADANVIPFWSGVVNSKEMIKSSLSFIQNERLDEPFPLRYTNEKLSMVLWEKLVKGYEADAVWTHMGLMFIEIVNKIAKRQAKEYLQQYKVVIEHYDNYLEVFTKKGKPFHSPFYYCDEGMLWAVMYLKLAGEII